MKTGKFTVTEVNEQTVGTDVEPAATDPLVQAVEAAVREGLIVVVAAGNVGVPVNVWLWSNRATFVSATVGLLTKFVPVIVTGSPADPLPGENPEIVGGDGAATVKLTFPDPLPLGVPKVMVSTSACLSIAMSSAWRTSTLASSPCALLTMM